jgi:hypothetical protein
MLLAADIFIFILLAITLYQDLSRRLISALLIPLLLFGFIVRGMQNETMASFLWDTAINMAFLLFQLLLLSIYFSLKNKKSVNIIDSYIGLGDVLFFAVIAAAFSPLNFIVFYLVALTLSLFGVLCYHIFVRKLQREVPLAGAVASVLMIVLFLSRFVPIDFYNDAAIAGLLSR